ncbi:outer membrane protein assembly factor BamA [Candidatus Comchoanobacter bicostacola]|uniref:Outer membrane protein assembly factor BamA n=1 Tax=Candidatus Comchoanobacter bicostacola TaxID=2919598 RepID=A0ABY5DJE7_9GAMM|nr:outer membrane protein assembly factor BamA [Candidatus Comchoanobacter bicostacola]UTC24663.1 outer membrane protein assembly factor BamA [Candidatus Comchoanobacter bicostacola]
MKISQFLLSFCLTVVSFVSNAEVVNEIEIKGLEKLNQAVVDRYIIIKEGEDISAGEIKSQVIELYNSGYFEQVNVDVIDGVLVIRLDEQPVINLITVESELIPESELEDQMKKLNIIQGEVLNETKVSQFVIAVKNELLSKGFTGVTVEHKLEAVNDTSVNLTLTVDAQARTKLKEIVILGELPFSERTLRSKLSSRTTGIASFYFNDDLYSEQQLRYDQMTLQRWLQSKGYLEAAVGFREETVTPSQRIWKNEYKKVYFTITPGPQYKISALELVDEYDQLTAQDQSQFSKDFIGTMFDHQRLSDYQERLLKKMNQSESERYVLDFDVQGAEDQSVAVTVVVAPVISEVRFIHFEDNNSTKDATLRKTIKLRESDLFIERDLQEDLSRLRGLSFIKNAQYRVDPVENGLYDVTYIVDEQKSTFQIGGNGGFDSGALNFSAFITETNLLGNGDSLSTSVSYSSGKKNANFSFNQPNVNGSGYGRSFSASIDQVAKESEQTTTYYFDQYSISGGLSKAFGDSISASLVTRYSHKQFNNIEKASKIVKDYFTNHDTDVNELMLSTSVQYRDIDSAYMPTHGIILSGGGGVTAPITDSAKYYTTNAQAIGYYPLMSLYDQPVVLRGRALFAFSDGYDNDGLPFFARRFAGGMGSVRGYKDNSLGPKYNDEFYSDNENGTPVLISKQEKPKGGGALLVANAEIQLPSPYPDFVMPYLFVDFGNVFDTPSDVEFSELRGSAGLTLTANLPVVAAKVSVSYAVKFNSDSDDVFKNLSFGFGTMF